VRPPVIPPELKGELMKKRSDIDAILYLSDVLFESHNGDAPTFSGFWGAPAPGRTGSASHTAPNPRKPHRQSILKRLLSNITGLNS
jgi:hypothetical protein